MRIAIVEDEQDSAALLEAHLKRFQEETGETVQYEVFRDGMDLVDNYQPRWDLIFLDIEMPLMDGMTAARKIRGTDREALIVFITRTAQYAMEGYEVSALDYVLKPVNYYAFSMKMRRTANLIRQREDKFTIVQNSSGMQKLSLKSLAYIEVYNHTLIYHTDGGTVSATGSKTINALEQELATAGFARCGQSYLVNLRHVENLDKDSVILTGGERVPVSRGRRKAFVQTLMKYWGG